METLQTIFNFSEVEIETWLIPTFKVVLLLIMEKFVHTVKVHY